MWLLPRAQGKVHRGLTELCELSFIRTFPSRSIPGCGWWDFLPFCLMKVARKLQVQGNTSRFAPVKGFSAEWRIWRYRGAWGAPIKCIVYAQVSAAAALVQCCRLLIHKDCVILVLQGICSLTWSFSSVDHIICTNCVPNSQKKSNQTKLTNKQKTPKQSFG